MNHESKCRHPHGHRYAVEVTCEADALDQCGRVIDFGAIKAEVGTWLDEHWDHGFIVNAEDVLMRGLLALGEEAGPFRHFVFPGEPSAENMAAFLLAQAQRLLTPCSIRVTKVRVWETPNCYADAEAQD